MQDAALDWVELGFKDQHLSRGDIWNFRRHLINNEPAVYVGKTISFEAIRAQVTRMVRAGRYTMSGGLIEQTKLRFRSRSAAFVLLIQASAEMGEFDSPSGELFHEKAIGFLRKLFRRWKALGISHSLSIVLFGRCYSEDPHAEERSGPVDGALPPSRQPSLAPDLSAEGRAAALMVDGAGRAYSDYYKLVAENEIREDWEPLLPTLKRHFLSFGPSQKRREPTTSALPGGAEMHGMGRGGVGRSSTAAHGNLLEAINLALDVLENSYEEQDLSSTGKSIICLSAGSGWFEVDYRLSQITNQRLTDNGIGCDLVCCGSPPLHTVPLFTYVHPGALGELPGESPAFRVPHWMLVSYTDGQPSAPLPSCRVTLAPGHCDHGTPPPSDETTLLLPVNVPLLSESPANLPRGSSLRSESVETDGAFDLEASLLEGQVFSPSASMDSDLMEGAASAAAGAVSGSADERGTERRGQNEGRATMGGRGMRGTGSREGVSDGWDPAVGSIAVKDAHGRSNHEGSLPRSHVSRSPRARASGHASSLGAAPRRIPTGVSDDAGLSPPSDYMYSSSPGSNPSNSYSDAGISSYGGLPQSLLASSPPPFHSSLGSLPQNSFSGSFVAGASYDGELHQSLHQTGSSRSSLTHGQQPTDGPPIGWHRSSSTAVGIERRSSSQALPRSGRLNPFSPSDAQALKKLSTNSYARRRWLNANHIADVEHLKSEHQGMDTHYSNSSVLQHLEHQWSSLSEPAVLPLTTDPTPEILQVMQTQTQQSTTQTSFWQLDVPRQGELYGVPYDHAMSAEELLQELLCQRLEQDFQLLRPSNQPKLLSLHQQQTYYLSQARQLQQITFVDAGRALPHPPRGGFGNRKPPSAQGALGAAAAGGATKFSEIRVTRHLLHRRGVEERTERSSRGQSRSDAGFGYHYFVCGPHGVGYQVAFSQIRPTTPHDYPWNRLDQVVCGWDCELDLKLRPRCKRFALLDFHEQREDTLRKLLSAPPGTQRLLSALLAKTTPSISAASVGVGGEEGSGSGQESSSRDMHAPSLSRDRFERFVASVRSKMPIVGDRVEWVDASGLEQDGGSRTHSQLVDMTSASSSDGSQASGTSPAGATRPRRMFVQLLFDANASPDRAWHLEIRWLMCQSQKVEDLIKFCARRAKGAGLLLLQVPTGRRPRPFSPPVLVPVSRPVQSQALLELRTQLCFVRENSCAATDLHAGRSTAELGDRWMHELGVAFVQKDKHGRGFLWSSNRLLPSQAGRSLSERLLTRFRELCERLTIESGTIRSEIELHGWGWSRHENELYAQQLEPDASTAVRERSTSLSGFKPEMAAPEGNAPPASAAAELASTEPSPPTSPEHSAADLSSRIVLA